MDFGHSLEGFSLKTGSGDFGGMITKGKIIQPKRTLKKRVPGGTNMPIKTHHGWEMENLEITVKGASIALMNLMPGRTLASQQLVIMGAFHDEWDGGNKTFEQEIWGRTEENDFFGEFEAEEDVEGKLDFAIARSRCSFGGDPVHYYDARTGDAWIRGMDMTESIRAALGRS